MRGKVGRTWLLLHLGEADEVWVGGSVGKCSGCTCLVATAFQNASSLKIDE